MEGFSNDAGRNFVRVTRGKFLIKDENGDFEIIADDGAKTRFKSFNKFSGTVVGIYHDPNGKFGPQWVVKISAGKTMYAMSFQRGSLAAQGLFNSLASLSSFQNLTFKSWSKDGAKTSRTIIYVDVAGEQIKWKYSQEEMPPVPPMKDENGDVIMEGNKPKLNTKARSLFFDKVIDDLNTKLGYVHGEIVDEETGEVSGGFSDEEEATTFAGSTPKATEADVAKATADVAF